jgi:predicted nucleotide-binding protein
MSKGKVLIVDDELMLIKYHVLALEQEGYDVSTVSTAADALARVDTQRYDVIVVDILMPVDKDIPEMRDAGIMDAGVHVAAAIRKRCPRCKLLIFTNVYQKAVYEWFARDSKARVLQKTQADPFRFVEEVDSLMEDKKPAPRVFIVCGRDKTAWLDLKNYLQNRLKFPEPVVLAEQGSNGTTVIEKFEQHASEIDVAFVIMTPDDVGNLAGSTGQPAGRARQNVIFELGYFMALLGRKSGRLVVLHKGPLEMASDLAGIIYIDISNGIEAAGEDIRRDLKAWL